MRQVASRAAVETAIDQLGAALASLDPQVRRRRVPARRVSLYVSDLDLTFTARLGPEGLTDVAEAAAGTARAAPVRFVTDSDTLVQVGRQPGRFPRAWLHGRVRVHAGIRDLWELRSAVL
jgi:hypothetical protein